MQQRRSTHGTTSGAFGRWCKLSRLIRDNGTSTEHAAQLQINADGSERIVPFDGFESHVVYRLYPDRPGWLDTEEALQLRALVDAFWSVPELPRRVGRALRQTEEITGARYLQNAIPLVVGGFESLLKIGRQHLSAQFSQRVPAIAAEVGIDLTVAECEDVYDDRSSLVHGFGLTRATSRDRRVRSQVQRAPGDVAPCGTPSSGGSRFRSHLRG